MAEQRQKTPAEIKAKLRDLLHRAAERHIRRGMVACPENCKHAPVLAGKVQPCPKCMANPGEPCKTRLRFEQRHTYDELQEQFKTLAKNKEWLVRNLRDVAMLLWVIGELEPGLEPDPSPLPSYLQTPREAPVSWMHLDGNTLILSPEVAALFQGFLDKLRERMPAP